MHYLEMHFFLLFFMQLYQMQRPPCKSAWDLLANPREHTGQYLSGNSRRGFQLRAAPLYDEGSASPPLCKIILFHHGLLWLLGCVAAEIAFVYLYSGCTVGS